MTEIQMNPMNLDPFASATTMLSALRARQVSAAELLDLHLQRIERYNPLINAIVSRDDDVARLTATAADVRRAYGDEGALLGLPLTVKDPIYVQGLPSTDGIPAQAEQRAPMDARVVARARAAGAVIMGKSNVPPYSADFQTANALFGRTNNPWDLTRTPGGSTGGGAAAVAAALTPLEFSGDFSGSIRQPAAFCGVYGHRPSETALPRSGYSPDGGRPNAACIFAVQGPLARSAADLAVALDVMAGPEVGEEVVWRVTLPRPRHERLAEYRVAVLASLDWLPVEREILGALEELVSRLTHVGVRVELITPETLGDLCDLYKLFLSLVGALISYGQPEERHSMAAELRRTGDEFESAVARGLEASAADYISWFDQRERHRSAYRSFFTEWDILITPVNIVTAFPHMDMSQGLRSLNIEGQEVAYGRQSAYASLATLSGQPATAFPASRTRHGLPIGLQAIGPYLEDRTPIHFAELLAQEWGGFHRPPGYTSD
jgi:amidase